MTRPLLKLTYKDPPEWTNSVVEGVSRFLQGERNFVVRAPIPEWDGVDPDTYVDIASPECLHFLSKHLNKQIKKAASDLNWDYRDVRNIRVEFTVGRDIAITADPANFAKCSWEDYTITRFRLALLKLEIGDKATFYAGDPTDKLFRKAKVNLLKHPQRRFVCESFGATPTSGGGMTVVRIPFEQSAYRAPKELRRSELVMPSF